MPAPGVPGNANPDPAQWTITNDDDGDPRAFFGTPFVTGDGERPAHVYGRSVTVTDNTEIIANVLESLVSGGDFTLSKNVFINFAADATSPGAAPWVVTEAERSFFLDRVEPPTYKFKPDKGVILHQRGSSRPSTFLQVNLFVFSIGRSGFALPVKALPC